MKFIIIPILFLVLLGCDTSNESKNDAEITNLDSLYKDYLDELLKFDPVSATQLGYKGYDHLYANNISDEYIKEKKQSLLNWTSRLNSIDKTQLTESQKKEISVLQYLVKNQLEGLEIGIQPGTIYTLHPLHSYHRSTHHEFVKLAKGSGAQPFKNKQDYDNFLLRLKGFKGWLETAQMRMEDAVSSNQTLPKKIVVKMIPQFDNWISTDPAINPFYGSLSLIPSEINAADSAEIVAAYSLYIETELIPVFSKMKTYLKNIYLEKSQSEDGISAIPGGVKQYEYLIKYWTTTNMTADDIHQKGLEEVARITNEMNSVKTMVGFEGSLQDFFAYINTDSKFFPFKTIDEVIQRHQQTLKTMSPYVDEIFGIQPKTTFEIRPVDPAIARAATANYDGPNLDGTRSGIFYDAIPEATEYNYFAMEALFLHEAIPGHHFQIALQMENKDIPLYRKINGFGVFSEGWGLYCESLGKELGLYTDPYQYMGRLQAEMLRAARLVVDTGLHTKGWTREQAIQYFRDVMPISEADATVHIERYMVRPGQSLSYKIGELKIKELRKKAERSLGDKFSLKEFHDLILLGGNIPLVVLEEDVNLWIDSKLSKN